jgi:sulfate transport system ATP-binding protein
MTVQIAELTRRYGAEAALADIDLDIADGEFLALLGPSGAGKTTLLRLIAGLDHPDAGSILIGDRDVHRLAPRDRRVGFVFQNYALFRHMTVARNIAFGLTVKPRRERPSRTRIMARVAELLDLMQLSGLGSRFPAQLSGGQRQRVALARALAIDPQVLLLDEPFGALDAKVRGELREWLRGLQRQLGLTTIFVTHDQHEAFELADRVAILNAGKFEQIGAPSEIRRHPRTPFVREFLDAAGPPTQVVAMTSIGAVEGHGPCPHTGRSTAAPVLASVKCDLAPHKAASVSGPSWTPRLVPLIPGNMSAADIPAVAAGELWLLALPDAESELTSLEYRALTSANIIIYDRALADAVAGVLPLGGYAEPDDGDDLSRPLQFVRDGWSVVRVIKQPTSDGGRAGRLRSLMQWLREADVAAGFRLQRLTESNGEWLGDDAWPDDADLLFACGQDCARDVIVVSVSRGFAPTLRAIASKGSAGGRGVKIPMQDCHKVR